MPSDLLLNIDTTLISISFTESNTVEQMILDAATSLDSGAGSSVLREDPPAGWGGSLGEEFAPSRWTFVAATQIPRQPGEVMVEKWLREALIALNPEIAAQPDRAPPAAIARGPITFRSAHRLLTKHPAIKNSRLNKA